MQPAAQIAYKESCNTPLSFAKTLYAYLQQADAPVQFSRLSDFAAWNSQSNSEVRLSESEREISRGR